MIAYLAPGVGRGKSTRAAAICRHLQDVVVFRDHPSGNEVLDELGVAWALGPPPGDASITVVDCTTRTLERLGWPVAGTVRSIYRAVRRLKHPGAVSVEHWTPDGMLDGWPILLREPLPRAEARSRLGVSASQSLVCWIESMFCPDSNVLEVAEAEARARRADLVQLYGGECMAAADLLVCASGLNTHTEAICAGVDVRWAPCERARDQRARLTMPVVRPARPDRSDRVARWVASGRTDELQPEPGDQPQLG